MSFSQNKIINLIITIDKEIVKDAYTRFVIIDTINNKNDTIRASYYPGRLSIEENDFNRIIKSDNIIFYIGIGKWIEGYGTVSRDYKINFRREWLFTKYYSLLHIYNQNKKWYKKEDSKKFGSYIYEFYTSEGWVLIPPRPTFLRRLLFKEEFKWW